jgi:hypothetical protein
LKTNKARGAYDVIHYHVPLGALIDVRLPVMLSVSVLPCKYGDTVLKLIITVFFYTHADVSPK